MVVNESFDVIRERILDATTNVTQSMTKDCGQLIVSLQDKVNTTGKWIIILVPLMLIFKLWAINKIISSKESQERKATLIVFTNTMLTSVTIIMMFYLFYFTFLSGYDW